MPYKYILLNQNGSRREFGSRTAQMTLQEMKKHLDCQIIAVIPHAYYPTALDKDNVTIYGDDEGRFNSDNHRNDHMKVLYGDPSIGEPPIWDCVGDMLVEIAT
jgi:hypothetical protein